MRVALFFDGKNFYSGWRDTAHGKRIDFKKLSDWLVKEVGGTSMWGAYYYTGVDESYSSQGEAHQKLAGFLEMLETQEGFFVKTFKRKIGSISCTECGIENRYVLEKEVDNAMVANMVQMAALNMFDAIVIMSGDTDFSEALSVIRGFGKQVYIGHWGEGGVSRKIRSSAYSVIDLLDGLPHFEREGSDDEDDDRYVPYCYENDSSLEITSVTGDHSMDAFLAELQQAQNKFSGGYVGLGYFLTRWRSVHLDTTPDNRRSVLDKLLAKGFVETYNASDGALAIRVSDRFLLDSGNFNIEDEDFDEDEKISANKISHKASDINID